MPREQRKKTIVQYAKQMSKLKDYAKKTGRDNVYRYLNDLEDAQSDMMTDAAHEYAAIQTEKKHGKSDEYDDITPEEEKTYNKAYDRYSKTHKFSPQDRTSGEEPDWNKYKKKSTALKSPQPKATATSSTASGNATKAVGVIPVKGSGKAISDNGKPLSSGSIKGGNVLTAFGDHSDDYDPRTEKSGTPADSKSNAPKPMSPKEKRKAYRDQRKAQGLVGG